MVEIVPETNLAFMHKKNMDKEGRRIDMYNAKFE